MILKQTLEQNLRRGNLILYIVAVSRVAAAQELSNLRPF